MDDHTDDADETPIATTTRVPLEFGTGADSEDEREAGDDDESRPIATTTRVS